ncbi:hypothetical protein [Pontibacter sp. G13]|uniref:hypothetical protein n=1 Tax=Pontibacter sp. G13 TaxID=3074898 RepID=UPI00288C5CDC|nr:hypothetical protein [Pontibacter sp. G13]WNJ18318.1 hypothetical protein RJD25_25985 [Pontibacter sp. G13]
MHTSNDVNSSWLQTLYVQNIEWLKRNPLGISYQEMNLLVYVVLGPLMLLLLIWGMIRT